MASASANFNKLMTADQFTTKQLRSAENYIANLRFRLEVAALPKPFQVAALGSRDLDLDTGKISWAFVALSLRDSR